MQPSLSCALVLALIGGSAAYLPSGADSGVARLQDELFPAASEPLSIPGPDDATWTVKELLDEYSRITDQTFVCDADTLGFLQRTGLGISRGLEVHPREVHSVVETLMIEHDFVFTWNREEVPRLFGVASLQTNARQSLRQTARFVPEDELEQFADHPARLITTAVTLDALDVRTLSNSLRTMLTDPNAQQIIPAGSARAVILTGFGDRVHGLAQMLRSVNELARMAPAQEGREAETKEKD